MSRDCCRDFLRIWFACQLNEKKKSKIQGIKFIIFLLTYILTYDSFVNSSKDFSSIFSWIPLSIFLRVPQMVHSITQYFSLNFFRNNALISSRDSFIDNSMFISGINYKLFQNNYTISFIYSKLIYLFRHYAKYLYYGRPCKNVLQFYEEFCSLEKFY